MHPAHAIRCVDVLCSRIRQAINEAINITNMGAMHSGAPISIIVDISNTLMKTSGIEILL